MRMKKGMGIALALAGLVGAGQLKAAESTTPASSNQRDAQTSIENYKATTERKKIGNRININNSTGGPDMAMPIRDYGMSPKEYGIRFGNGGNKRSNRLRYSHNAKVRRRKA